jgi:hypothetical protein
MPISDQSCLSREASKLAGGQLTNIENPNNTGTQCWGITPVTLSGGVRKYFDRRPAGYMYQTGQFTDVNPPNDLNGSFAFGINSKEEMVGDYVDGAWISHGFLLNGTTYTVSDVPNSRYASAFGINDNGVITVTWYDSSNVTQSSLYDGSTCTTINVPGALQMNATGINNSGDVVFYWENSLGRYHRAVLRKNKYYKLDSPPIHPAISIAAQM